MYHGYELYMACWNFTKAVLSKDYLPKRYKIIYKHIFLLKNVYIQMYIIYLWYIYFKRNDVFVDDFILSSYIASR